VNTVTNLRGHKRRSIRLAERLLASQKGFCSVESVNWLLGWLVGWFEYLTERDHMEDLNVDGRIILACILEKYGGEVSTGFI